MKEMAAPLLHYREQVVLANSDIEERPVCHEIHSFRGKNGEGPQSPPRAAMLAQSREMNDDVLQSVK